MTRPRVAVHAALAIAVAAATSCQRAPDRRSYVERAVTLAPEIEHATGMKFVSPARVEVRTHEQVRAFVERELQDSLARADVVGMEAAYKRLGMIPDSLDLRALLSRVLAQQVVGYYDPRSKTLYVVEGADSAAAETTLRHELVHALQDQHVNVDSLQRIPGENDATAAVHAALEGEATFVQFASGGITLRAPGTWEKVRAAIRDNMERTPVLADAPLVVRETLLFPYLSGAELARRVADHGGSDSVLRRLPTSTEQVMHADAYYGKDGGRPDLPTTITLPAPSVGQVTHANTLGEFETRLLLFQHTQDLDQAARAAMGWDGDRFAIVRTPQGDAFVWMSVWDSEVDAVDFYDAMSDVVPRRYEGARAAAVAPAPAAVRSGRGVPQQPAGNVRQWTAAGRSIVLRGVTVQGRPCVLYVDAPEGVPLPLVDVTRVTLRE